MARGGGGRRTGWGVRRGRRRGWGGKEGDRSGFMVRSWGREERVGWWGWGGRVRRRELGGEGEGREKF